MAINKATALAEIDSVFAHRSSLGPTLTDVLLVEMITLWCIRNDAAHANYNKYGLIRLMRIVFHEGLGF